MRYSFHKDQYDKHRPKNEYPLFWASGYCKNPRFVGGTSKYLCECKDPETCRGVALASNCDETFTESIRGWIEDIEYEKCPCCGVYKFEHWRRFPNLSSNSAWIIFNKSMEEKHGPGILHFWFSIKDSSLTFHESTKDLDRGWFCTIDTRESHIQRTGILHAYLNLHCRDHPTFKREK